MLRRWWVRKYHLPATSDAYLAQTPEELLIEFFEDYLAEHPEAALERRVDTGSGQSYFVTGDPEVDRWEREIAEGREPDFDALLSTAQRDAETRRGQAHAEPDGFGGIDERYDD